MCMGQERLPHPPGAIKSLEELQEHLVEGKSLYKVVDLRRAPAREATAYVTVFSVKEGAFVSRQPWNILTCYLQGVAPSELRDLPYRRGWFCPGDCNVDPDNYGLNDHFLFWREEDARAYLEVLASQGVDTSCAVAVLSEAGRSCSGGAPGVGRG